MGKLIPAGTGLERYRNTFVKMEAMMPAVPTSEKEKSLHEKDDKGL